MLSNPLQPSFSITTFLFGNFFLIILLTILWSEAPNVFDMPPMWIKSGVCIIIPPPMTLNLYWSIGEIFPNVFMVVVLSVASDEKLFAGKVGMLYQDILSIFTTVNFALGKSAKINWQMSSCRSVQAWRT